MTNKLQDEMKKRAAYAVLDWIEPGMIIGVGTGSTVNFFIEALETIKHRIRGVVASSVATAVKIKALDIPLVNLNDVDALPLYIDSADEINSALQMIKGGGGALTGEKIVASTAQKMICIADMTKKVDLLGQFPIAVEVIPMARSFVAREICKLEGRPVYRQGFVSDYGHVILDVHDLKLLEPRELEVTLNQIPGVVENGLFACRRADVLLLGTDKGVEIIK